MRITSEGPLLEEMSRDAGILVSRPRAVFFADSEADVTQAFAEADRRGLAVTPRGAGTSIPSQAVGRGLTLLQRSSLVSIVPGLYAVADPGAVKADLNRVVEKTGLWMPVDPSSYQSCTVGGMVANNSSGVRTPMYGSTIDYVIGLRAVFPGSGPEVVAELPVEDSSKDGGRWRKVASLVLENLKDIESERPRVTKNSSGYRLERVVHDGMFDPTKLLVGSEGTLGVVTQVTFRLVAKPAWKTLFIVEAGLERINEISKAFRRMSPSALELVDKTVFEKTKRKDKIAKYSRTEEEYMVFCEFEGMGSSQEKLEEVAGSEVGGFDPVVLTDGTDVADAWAVRNETLTLASEMRKDGKILVPGVEDLVVPPENLKDLIALLVDEFESRGLEFISYGHAGDANLHARPLLDIGSKKDMRVLEDLMDSCFEKVWRLGGSITGEHGDGRLRAPYVERQYPKTYWVMKEIRKVLDPKGLLSPGVKIV